MVKASAQAAVSFHDYAPDDSDFLAEVVEGLSKTPKQISPKFFYDQRGSELFDAICEQPEYYPTRTEISILQTKAHHIAELIGSECVLVELGSGASEKVRLLFDALKPAAYMGVDISKEFLLRATQNLAKDYPWLDVHAVCTDFSSELQLPKDCHHQRLGQQLVAFFPGSSIGNFEPEAAMALLKRIAHAVGKGGKLLVGVDLKKDKAILDAAYNDDAGITAEFNLNLLQRMQDELDAELDADAFSHHAFYNAEQSRVEMHLVSDCEQTIEIQDNIFELKQNETIHTENSHKYSIAEFSQLAQRAGFEAEQVWTDDNALFSVQLLKVI